MMNGLVNGSKERESFTFLPSRSESNISTPWNKIIIYSAYSGEVATLSPSVNFIHCILLPGVNFDDL